VASIPFLRIAVLWFALVHTALADEQRTVLVLFSNNRLVPANVAVDRGLRAALVNPSDRTTRIFSEFLDRPEFSGEDYERTMTTYLREKYAAHPPDAIVAVSDESLDFVLRRRDQLFPHVPVVFTAVAQSLLRTFPALPIDVVGVPVEYDHIGTIELALRWHPDVRRLVIVSGASERDRQREAMLRRDVPAIAGGREVEFLARLPTAEVLRRLGALDRESVVFTFGYFQDGEGRLSNPRDTAALMAGVSSAPLYGPLDTFIGIGAVGGRMPSFDDMGRQVGQILNALFAGTAPSSLRLPSSTPAPVRVDWRQVRRWGIDESLVPPDAIVSFREPTFWEMYRKIVIGALLVILLQSVLIAALLVERRRRRKAEGAVLAQRTELAHASRLAVAGELTASIAHEINQPLGAIQTSADAADMILQAGGDRRDDLLRIVTRIRNDNMRASDVIRRLRSLLARHAPERKPIDLNAVMGDVAALLHAEARRRQVTLDLRPSSAPARVLGDETQMQQVLINLVLNAMDAEVGLPEARRIVIVGIEPRDDAVAITVRDRGHGIAPDNLPKVFESFFSTKQKGMGLGLSIARTIVEAHGGRIWAESATGDGAMFHVELLRAEATGAIPPVLA
jgi:signal transduction histidine kinase